MKRKVLSDFIKKTLYVSLICASLCGAVTAAEVYAASNLTVTAMKVDKEIGDKGMVPIKQDLSIQNDVLLFAEGNLISTPDGILNYKDSTYLPLRKIGEALGAEVKWYEQEKIAQVDLNGRIVEIFSQHYKSVVTVNGNSEVRDVTAKVDGKEVKLPSILQKGSLYLPTRFVSESLGLNIKWHNNHPETGQKTITIGKETGLNYKKPEAPKSNYDNLNKIPGKDDGGNLIHYNPINPDWDAFFSQVNEGSGAKAVQGQFYIDRGSICAMFDHNGDGYIGDPNTKYYAKVSELGKIDREELKKYQAAENKLYTSNKLLTPKPTKPGTSDGQVSADGMWTFWTDTNQWEPNGNNDKLNDCMQSLWRNNPIKTTITD